MRVRRARFDGYDHPVEIGRHESTVIYRGWQARFQRYVAIHVLLGTSPERFESDRKLMGLLAGHPNVVDIHEAGYTQDGLPYVVTDLFEGRSLAALVREEGLSWQEATRIAVKLAGVVESARRAGADLAVDPTTVFLSRFREPKLSAFGAQGANSDVASLEATFAFLLTRAAGVPEGFQSPANAADPLDFATRLQRAQGEAGLPVTDVPLAVEGPHTDLRPHLTQ